MIDKTLGPIDQSALSTMFIIKECDIGSNSVNIEDEDESDSKRKNRGSDTVSLRGKKPCKIFSPISIDGKTN